MLLDALTQEDEESEIDYAKLKEKHMTEKLGVTEKEPAFRQKTPDRTDSVNCRSRNYKQNSSSLHSVNGHVKRCITNSTVRANQFRFWSRVWTHV